MRARLYSSWASSTWSLPSAERVVGEDVEDDRRPVDDRHAELLLEVALLARQQLVVDRDQVRVGLLGRLLQLGELPAAEVAVRIGPLAALHHLARDRHAGGAQELAQLGQIGVVGGDADRQRALGGASCRAVLDCIHRFKSRARCARHESVRDRRNGVHRIAWWQRLRDRGDEVVVLARRPEKAGGLDAEVVQGDLSDADAIRRGMEGCQAVFHIAADYRVGMDPSKQDSMRDSNIGGTERVLDAAADAGVEKIVYVSTINVFGNTSRQTVDESYRRDEADGFVSTYDETSTAPTCSPSSGRRGRSDRDRQPGSVYGPGDHALVGQMIEQASTGKMPAKAFPELGLNMVHVDDVADGIMLAYDKGKPGESYVLGGEITTQGELIDKAAIGGKKPPRMTVPPVVLKAMIPVSRRIGPPMGPPPNFREMISAAHNVTYWAKRRQGARRAGLPAARPRHRPGGMSRQVEPLDRRQHTAGRELPGQARPGQDDAVHPARVPDREAVGASAHPSASISSMRRCQRSPPSSAIRSPISSAIRS